ncbi:unnamed protein product [Clonostachys rosea f. rosea IK726]|uniref:Uncharacterized protein n=2 Tax=Bionectria ochroleuca TaxID=29856 RepID=A0A0B7K3R0_BIOOC|nr:unnamed protein product [Clonostachys rosea f. rosea IK726]
MARVSIELPLMTHNGRPDTLQTAPKDNRDTKKAGANWRDAELQPLHTEPGISAVTESKMARETTPLTTDAAFSERAQNGQSGGSKWRPFWLHSRVLLLFLAFFIGCMIALPVLLSYSSKHKGITEVRQGFEKPWRFISIAVLTLVAIFWNRVELQVLRYAPWIAVQPNQPLDRAMLDLDYVSMMPPVALFHSLKNKHFLVFTAVLTSIICKAQIVLSPSLFFSETTKFTYPTEIQLLDSFDTSFDVQQDIREGTGNTAEKTGPYYNSRAVRKFDLELPFGVSQDAAYQTFSSGADGTDTRGTIQAPVTATVDALFMDIECLKLENYTASRNRTEEGIVYANLELKFEQCDQPLSVSSLFFYIQDANITTLVPPNFWAIETLSENHCSILPTQFSSFIYYGALPKGNITEDASTIEMEAFGALMCAPKSWISKVRVTDNGVSPIVSSWGPDQQRTPFNVSLWDIIPGSLSNDMGHWFPNQARGSSGAIGPVNVESRLWGRTPVANDTSLYQTNILYEATRNMTKYFGPMAAHYRLKLSNDSADGDGYTTVARLRLKANRGVCIAMTVLFSLSATVALWSIVSLRRNLKPWHRDPATILGSMIFFDRQNVNQAPSMESLLDKPASTLPEQSNSTYTMLPLRTWVRSMYLVYVMGLIAALAITLHISQSSIGLITIDQGTSPLWWASLPALAMAIVSLYATSCDTAVRDIAILSKLSSTPCNAMEIDMSLLDMLGFTALYYSLRLRLYTVTITQLIAIVCGVLVSLSGILYSSQHSPKSTPISFEPNSWFGYRTPLVDPVETYMDLQPNEYEVTRNDLSSLVLAQNTSTIKYPQWTYRDLVFPSFAIDEAVQFRDSGTSVRVTIPAARLTPDCIQLNNTAVEKTITCPNGTEVSYNLTSLSRSTGYYASMVSGERTPGVIRLACDLEADELDDRTWTYLDQTYSWGRISNSGTNHSTEWSCNYTWAEVPTVVTFHFVDGKAQIDYDNPPTAAYDQSKPYDPPFSIPIFSQAYTAVYGAVFPQFNLPNSDALQVGYEFAYLVEPFGSIKLEDLADANQEEKILEALHFSRAQIAAQLANLEHRFALNETSGAQPAQHGKLPPIEGSLTDYDRYRLIQSFEITMALIVLLSIFFVINLWALISAALMHFLASKFPLLLDLELKGKGHHDLNSIRMTDSFLSESNYSDYLPKNAALLSLRELYNQLAGVSFKMGRFWRKDTKTAVYTVGVLDNSNLQLLDN